MDNKKRILLEDFFIKLRKMLLTIVDDFLLIISLLVFLLMIYNIGFLHSPETRNMFMEIYSVCLLLYFVIFLLRIPLIIAGHYKKSLVKVKFMLFSLMILYFISFVFIRWFGIDFILFRIFSHVFFIYLIVSFVFFIELSKNSLRFYKIQFNAIWMFVLSFIIVIFAGAGFLMLPKATNGGIRFIDALFTSASAVCVTGLTVVDTATKFTFLGKSVILILIQIGGLGLMVFTSVLGLFFRGDFSFNNQVFLRDIVNENKINEVFSTLIKIIFFTLLIESAGAAIIFFNIDHQFIPAIVDRIQFSIFHSVSAFCNAGFSTLTNNLFDIHIRYNYTIQLTIAFAIILGGIGFPVMLNHYSYFKLNMKNRIRAFLKIRKFEHSPRLINVNSKIVILTTFLLLALGTVLFFFIEYNNTLKEHATLYGKIVVSFFNSVTPRTAGFNNIDMAQLMKPTLLVIMFLMWVGASPASTGGGVKTSAFAVALLNILSMAKGKDRTEVYRREIADDSIKKAFGVILLSLIIIGAGGLVMSFYETNKSVLALYFECFSAYGTVGLSVGITPFLTDASKGIIILTMFLGRIGMLTVIMGLFSKVKSLNYHYPKENVFIT